MADDSNNTRNPQSTLFKRLTRLLSGPIVNYRAQTPRKEKRRHMDKYDFTSASGKSFKKTTYISSIGIYDENKNLIGIAKVATPVKKTEDREFTFKLK